MKVAFVYAGGREGKWEAALAGSSPSDFFYGAVELSKRGHQVRCVDAPGNPRSLPGAVYNRLLGWRTPVRTRGEHLAAVGAVLGRLKGADAVVATSTSHANALAMWRRIGGCPAPIAGIHCGLVNFPLKGARLRSTRGCLRGQEIVLFAESERAETVSRFRLEPERVHANPFGVDADFWSPGSREAGGGFLAVGNDGRRDYGTLIRAMEGAPHALTIVTARELPAPLPPNVRHVKGSWHRPAVSDAELRELYRSARAVIVPLEDSLQPSGQSVALQAMACGRPVVLTRTRGLWTGAEFLDGRQLLLAEPGNSGSLRRAMDSLAKKPGLADEMGSSARNAVAGHGTMNAFAARLERLLMRITNLSS